MEVTFSDVLKNWRSRRGWSQLALGLEAGVSSRHISFLETGRARPSQDMVLRLAGALDLPLRERNGLLLSAGFAPRFGEHSLDSEALHQAREAVKLMLAAHEPYPAFGLDRYWNIVLWNRPMEILLGEAAEKVESISQINALDLVFQPGGMREQFENWEEVAAAVLRRLRRQVVRAAADERLQSIWRRAVEAPGVEALIRRGSAEESPPILVPMRIRQDDRTLSWINTLATFGATGDATLEELVVESLFPGDRPTRDYVKEVVAAGAETRH